MPNFSHAHAGHSSAGPSFRPRAGHDDHFGESKPAAKGAPEAKRARGKINEDLAMNFYAQYRSTRQRPLNIRVDASHYVIAKATPKRFEPLRAEPNGFLVHLLSHSDKVSCYPTHDLSKLIGLLMLSLAKHPSDIVLTVCGPRCTFSRPLFFLF